MPKKTKTKNKSHSGISKRVKQTGSGKLRRQKAGKRHLLEKKSADQKRHMSGTTEVAKADEKRIKTLLGV